jgi:uncharacterized protein (DUF885 family)
MQEYKNYFDDNIKIDPSLSFYIGNITNKTLSHYTDYISNKYLKDLFKLYRKYKNTKDIQLKLDIDYIKNCFKYKIYLYNLLSSYDNDIINFEYATKNIYPTNNIFEISRRNDFKSHIKNLIIKLAQCLKLKITVPYIICKKYMKQIRDLDNFKDYKELYAFIATYYLYKCRKTIGLCDLPNGKKIYKILILNYLGCNKTPQEIHKLGLKLVKKPIITHTTISYSSREELFKDCLKYSLYIYNNIIDKYFHYKPSKPFIIKKVPEFLEMSMSLAYYSDIENAVFINLRYYKECDKKTLYSLLMHECFHQYHYEFMKYYKLPKYKIYGYNNISLIEGFAHYMEMYCEDYDDINNEYSLLRKMRLVVDTGINYYGWSYKKALDYMTKYRPDKNEDNINEIDRYICMPAQSLCYVIGKYEIIKMRDNFIKNKKGSIKDFHHKLLINGTVSFTFLKTIL